MAQTGTSMCGGGRGGGALPQCGPSLGEVTQVSAGWWSPACILDSFLSAGQTAGSTIVPEEHPAQWLRGGNVYTRWSSSPGAHVTTGVWEH